MRCKDRALLFDLLSVQSKSRNQGRMIQFMQEKLTEFGMEVVRAGEQLYARKGNREVYVPYFVAHADTVHGIVPDDQYRVTALLATDGDIIYRAYDPTTGLSRGVGGDDKCGLYACLYAAQNMDDVGVLVTVDEEIGCVGAGLVHEELLIRPGCMIQLDRRGNGDAVDAIGGPICSDEWKAAMSPVIAHYGYKWTFGAITDVGTLAHDMRLSAINLSAGYFNPHGADEYVSETDLEFAIELAIDIAYTAGNEEWNIPEAVVRRPKRSTWEPQWQRQQGWNMWDGEDDNYGSYADYIDERDKARAQAREPEALLKEEAKMSSMYRQLGIDVYFDADGFEKYEQFVEFRDAQNNSQHEQVTVELRKPENWEFVDDLLQDAITPNIEDDITAQVLSYWTDNVEPVLLFFEMEETIGDAGDDADLPPETMTVGELVREVVEGMKGQFCEADDCDKPWVAYSVSDKRWMCSVHYEALSHDPPHVRDQIRAQTNTIMRIRAEELERKRMVKDTSKAIVDSMLGPAGPMGTVVETPEVKVVA